MKNKIILVFLILLVFLFQHKQPERLPHSNKLLMMSTNIEDTEIEQDVEDQLSNIDFSKLNSYVNNFGEEEKKILNSNNFLEIVKNFINSNNSYNFKDFLSYIISILFAETMASLPYFLLIFIISTLFGIIQGSSLIKTDGTKKIVSLVCTSSVSVIIFKIVFNILKNSTLTITSITNLLEMLLPIILTLIVAIGGANTAAVFQPTLAVFCSVVVQLFSNILVPIFIFSIVFNIVGNLYGNIKLEKFSKFLNSLFKSIIGVVFTIFIAFLSIQGLTSSVIDGASIKTAKYALKNYIPILGSYLSDGVGLILLSSSIIKNSVGVAGLLVIIFVVIKPILQILIFSLLFKLFSAILETISTNHSKLLYETSKSLSMVNLCLIAVGVMALISVSILLSISNIV